MDRELLRRVQLAQLEMLKEIKRVCKIIHVDYFLDAGTLLGAIRHSGFIPWDDDLDIGMTRENYECFLKEAPKILADKYFLQTWYSDVHYGLPFAKLRKNNTVYIENNAKNSNAHNGLYVDIFPYDVYPNNKSEQSEMAWKLDFVRRCILIKNDYTPFASDSIRGKICKSLLYLPIDIYSLLKNRRELIETYEKYKTKYNGNITEYYYPAGTFNFGSWLIPNECLLKYEEHTFEDDEFMIPQNVDSYLTYIYGDYMTLPPVDKRENRHDVLKVKL